MSSHYRSPSKPLKRSARTTSRTRASNQLEQWKAQIRHDTYAPDADLTRFEDRAPLPTDEYRAHDRKTIGRSEAAIVHLKELSSGTFLGERAGSVVRRGNCRRYSSDHPAPYSNPRSRSPRTIR